MRLIVLSLLASLVLIASCAKKHESVLADAAGVWASPDESTAAWIPFRDGLLMYQGDDFQLIASNGRTSPDPNDIPVSISRLSSGPQSPMDLKCRSAREIYNSGGITSQQLLDKTLAELRRERYWRENESYALQRAREANTQYFQSYLKKIRECEPEIDSAATAWTQVADNWMVRRISAASGGFTYQLVTDLGQIVPLSFVREFWDGESESVLELFKSAEDVVLNDVRDFNDRFAPAFKQYLASENHRLLRYCSEEGTENDDQCLKVAILRNVYTASQKNDRRELALLKPPTVNNSRENGVGAMQNSRADDTGSSAPLTDQKIYYVTGLDPNGDNFLALRSGIDRTATRLRQLPPNTMLFSSGETRGIWLKVKTMDGVEGWVAQKYTACCVDPRTIQ